MSQEYVKKAEDTFEQLLVHLGIRFDETFPKHKLAFPSDPTALSDQELLSQIAYWTRFSGYVLVKAAIIKSASRLAESKYDNRYSQEYLKCLGAGRVTDVKHKVTASSNIKKYKSDSVDLTNKFEMLNSLGHTYEKYASVLSRELTRRTSTK